MEIKKINLHDAAYRSLAGRNGTVFNSPDWLQQYEGNLELNGIYNGNELAGAFYVYRERRRGFTFWKNPPFTPHIGLVADAKSTNASKAMSENKKMMTAVAGYLDSRGKGVVSCALPPWATDMQPFTWKKFKVVPNYTYQTDLKLGEKELEGRMSSEHRNHLKKALKDGLRCVKTEDTKLVRELVLKTFDRKQKSLDGKMLDSILNKFATASNSFAFTAYDKDQPIATAFCIMDHERVYNLLSGYDPALRHGGAGIMCVWNSILHAKQLGRSVFDFEGSMLPEVERYFRGFGPGQVAYYTVNKAWLPIEMMLKFIKREQF